MRKLPVARGSARRLGDEALSLIEAYGLDARAVRMVVEDPRDALPWRPFTQAPD